MNNNSNKPIIPQKPKALSESMTKKKLHLSFVAKDKKSNKIKLFKTRQIQKSTSCENLFLSSNQGKKSLQRTFSSENLILSNNKKLPKTQFIDFSTFDPINIIENNIPNDNIRTVALPKKPSIGYEVTIGKLKKLIDSLLNFLKTSFSALYQLDQTNLIHTNFPTVYKVVRTIVVLTAVAAVLYYASQAAITMQVLIKGKELSADFLRIAKPFLKELYTVFFKTKIEPLSELLQSIGTSLAKNPVDAGLKAIMGIASIYLAVQMIKDRQKIKDFSMHILTTLWSVAKFIIKHSASLILLSKAWVMVPQVLNLNAVGLATNPLSSMILGYGITLALVKLAKVATFQDKADNKSTFRITAEMGAVVASVLGLAKTFAIAHNPLLTVGITLAVYAVTLAINHKWKNTSTVVAGTAFTMATAIGIGIKQCGLATRPYQGLEGLVIALALIGIVEAAKRSVHKHPNAIAAGQSLVKIGEKIFNGITKILKLIAIAALIPAACGLFPMMLATITALATTITTLGPLFSVGSVGGLFLMCFFWLLQQKFHNEQILLNKAKILADNKGENNEAEETEVLEHFENFDGLDHNTINQNLSNKEKISAYLKLIAKFTGGSVGGALSGKYKNLYQAQVLFVKVILQPLTIAFGLAFVISLGNIFTSGFSLILNKFITAPLIG